MRKLFLAIGVLLISACNEDVSNNGVTGEDVTVSASANGKNKSGLPEMTFEEEQFDFGLITQGEKVSHAFTFKNTGASNLIISGARGSCGCTVPEWPKEPILPGKDGKINVVFNSEGKEGKQEKVVTIVTNCEPSTRVVRIKAEIAVAKAAR